MTDDRFARFESEDDSSGDDRPDPLGTSDQDGDEGAPFSFLSQASAAARPAWLSEFEELANRELGSGSACEQVHPHVAEWYDRAHNAGPLESRDSIQQAMACLSTEVLNAIPDDFFEDLMEIVDEDTLAAWIEYVLFIGRAFEKSLSSGEFDDL